MKVFLVFTIVLLAVKSNYGAVPKTIDLCKYGDTDCLRDRTTVVANTNPHGNKDLNLPDLEPLRIKSLNIGETGARSALNLNINLKDIDMYGLSTIKIDRVVGFGSDPASSKFEIYATIPKLNLKGKYKASGRVLILPIQGEGPCDFTLDKVKVSIKIKPTVTIKDGKNYIQVDKFKMLLEPAKLTVRLENLFNGDPALGQNMNTFLNENWKDLWTEIGPSIDAGMGEIIKNIISNVFKIGAYDDLFRA